MFSLTSVLNLVYVFSSSNMQVNKGGLSIVPLPEKGVFFLL